MADLDRKQCLGFLRARPAKLAHVSAVRADGASVTVPVWYRIDDEDRMLIWTGADRKWAQHAARAGRLSFSVAEEQFPLRGVLGGGAVELLGDGGELDIDAERERIIGAYVMPFLVAAYTASRAEYRAILRVTLDRLSGWTFDAD